MQSTKGLYTTLKTDDISEVCWYADAAFAIHQDMKSHTGGVMMMGKGCMITISSKQKINMKSSMEAELVGVDDVLGPLLWTKNFLEAQGYKSQKMVLYQDNTSAMLLEKNGRESASKRTHHINIRYFFIKDHIQAKDLEVKYCPTDDMVANYLTKPLKGAKFKKFRKAIMNLSH